MMACIAHFSINAPKGYPVCIDECSTVDFASKDLAIQRLWKAAIEEGHPVANGANSRGADVTVCFDIV